MPIAAVFEHCLGRRRWHCGRNDEACVVKRPYCDRTGAKIADSGKSGARFHIQLELMRLFPGGEDERYRNRLWRTKNEVGLSWGDREQQIVVIARRSDFDVAR